MKKSALIPLICSCLLLTGCKSKRIMKIVTPDPSVRYAFYMDCLVKGQVIDVPELRPDLGEPVAIFTLSNGESHIFYATNGYEFY